ncbi:hypothetical protein KIN20_034683 [Parelaphostrongylus tenuis]|uniref:FLYWCH-type domain-containing protein n=1 Tax=Parelaphostrongylus tenuis TaxID=148309 RepID=A0AAD5RA12_PARTN|nr:hypothetical protein KIN20_034683 [Parelaphostrongylus tenuis]
MAVTEDNALTSLHQFIAATQRSPDKLPLMDDIMGAVLQQIPAFNYPTPVDTKPAGSSDSDTPRNQSPNSDGQTETQPAVSGKEPRPYRQEPWHECFTTVHKTEFDALIYSLYVMMRDDKKLDGYEYYECINRLQSKCRYRVRARKMNEFIIVEERGAHNHAMEPVGTPGTHAGLPKTLREIVDRSFYEDWNNAVRQEKLEEEVRRLGLPHNPRLGRQVDNRIAYLRRVKNLNEMKRIQDQAVPLPSGEAMNDVDVSKTNGTTTTKPTEQIPSSSADMENTAELLKLLMQGGQLPELNPESQAQLLALVMGSAGLVQLNEQAPDEQAALSAIISALSAGSNMPLIPPNPFIGNNLSSIASNLLSSSEILSTNDNSSSDSKVDDADEVVGMDEDDDCSTEDDQLQIDTDS